jgi:endoglucanase
MKMVKPPIGGIFPLAIILLCLSAGCATPSAFPTEPSAGVFYRGLDIFGPFQNGVTGQPWAFPTDGELKYYASKGLKVFRVPLLWEDLQPRLYGPLDRSYLAAMDAFVADCRAHGEEVIWTFINQAVRPLGSENVIGSAALPATAFYDVWKKVALHYRNVPTVWAYDLINEPYLDDDWVSIQAQQTIYAIRSVDMKKVIIAMPQWENEEGYVAAFQGYNDPGDNLWYEDHVYFDRGSNGFYLGTYDEEGAYPTIGIDRVRPFVTWCRVHHAHCTVGEFGVPGSWTGAGTPVNDPRWEVVLDNFLSYLDQNGISSNYWEAGPYGDTDSVEPTTSGQDSPQMAILTKHPSHWPSS